ncbi:hypothetical protein MAPG_01512 [Magnaporthiopsis poae ATCC 64411]|uniref:Polysaccharide synthase Cps1p n=1 Tax=Magnaporthiopsis poae (strain ATCC 64411 / 73-15) TaxID=644358 RepID=A0A0C4DNW5_MAGP6|nr:hypothetical protein MAPG_01512 [Magnaporthiopsis poae ATCC 64411]
MAAATLLALCLRDQVEKLIDSRHLKAVAPTPVPDDPTYKPSRDVSVVVPTIDTPDSFVHSLASWLAADPLEIIIVTTPEHVVHVQSLISSVKATVSADLAARVSLHLVDAANKRRQMAKGAHEARGRIVCFADDDVIWPSPRFLKSILACFEDPRVGGAGGGQRPHLPEDRRNAAVITPWEVAAVRRLGRAWRDWRALRKITLDFLFRPLISCLFLYAWVGSLFESPKITLLVSLVYLSFIAHDLARFFIRNPYCAKAFWAVILADYSYLVLDVYAWFTLGNVGWLTRPTASTADQWIKLVSQRER